jgi:hypothetical protein
MRRLSRLSLAFAPVLALSCTGAAPDGSPSQGSGGAPEEGSSSFPELSGPYLGQAPALSEPVLFAPGVVSTGLGERDVAMMPDGSEIYWAVVVGQYEYTTVMVSRRVEGVWTEPEVAPCCSQAGYMHLEPHITPDGEQFMWLSNRPGPGVHNGGQEIWAMDRVGDGWGEAYPLPETINTADSEYFPSVTRDGTLYFTRSPAGGGVNRIWRSRKVGGEYQEPELLPDQVNAGRSRFNAFIDPDETFLLLSVTGMEDTQGGTDYYVVFRNEEDEWSDPVNLGPLVNTAGSFEYSPYVSPDGQFFFFMGNRVDEARLAPGGVFDGPALRRLAGKPENGEWDIYWMDAAFLDELRPEGF